MIIQETRFALDTNILVYLLEINESRKRFIASNKLTDNPIICTQVVSEFLNVSKRKLNISKIEIMQKCINVLGLSTITQVSITTLNSAKELIEKHQLQIFDAIIVASAIESNCSILYSEDLQHNQKFENSLTIINPFL